MHLLATNLPSLTVQENLWSDIMQILKTKDLNNSKHKTTVIKEGFNSRRYVTRNAVEIILAFGGKLSST